MAISLFLTSTGSREYPFLVKGGTDSELNGRERRVARKSEFPLPALIEDATEQSERVGVCRIEEEWMDVGRPQELKKARGETLGKP